MSFLPCWPIGLITSSIELTQPICFTFTYCSAYGPNGCHSCHVGPLGLLPPPLDFPSPFALLLPFVVLMGLLVVIHVMLALQAYYLFPWAFSAHLLYFYIFYFFFLPSFLIVGLLLLLYLFCQKWTSTLSDRETMA